MENKYKPSNIVAGLGGYARDIYSRARDTVRDFVESDRSYTRNHSYLLPIGGYNQGGSYEDTRRRGNIAHVPKYA